MAKSIACLTAEEWIRNEALPKLFGGLKFEKKKLKLKSGGEFEFDAVSSDGTVVAVISTSEARTKTGKEHTGAIHKIRGEGLFFSLLETPAVNPLFIFTSSCMWERFEKEQRNGRWPLEFRNIPIQLPADIQAQVMAVRINSRRGA